MAYLSSYNFYFFFRLSSECSEMDKEILATKAEVSPTKPDIKLNLVSEEDRVTPLENSSTNQSTASSSSTDTVVVAKECNHLDSKKDGKTKLCSNKTTNQNNSSNETSETEQNGKKSNSPNTLVFKLDTDSGKLVTSAGVKSEQKESINGSDEFEKVSESLDKNCNIKDDKIDIGGMKRKSNELKNKSSFLDKLETCEKRDEELMMDDSVDSDDESDSNLNTTDDLIAASMGLIKLDSGKGHTSDVSDQLVVSGLGCVNSIELRTNKTPQSFVHTESNSINDVGGVSVNDISGGNNSSSSVLIDASRLYDISDRALSDISDRAKNDVSNRSNNQVNLSTEVTEANNSTCEKELKKLSLSQNNLQKGGHCVGKNDSRNSKLSVGKNDSQNGSHSSDDFKDEEVPSILRTSLNQFLSSRLSRSRNLEDSRNLTSLTNNSDLKMNRSDMKTYYPLGFHTPAMNEHSSMNGFDSFCNYSSPSLKSFEHHEKDVRYRTRSQNGSKSSDYSSQESMVFPEGSFTGQGKHRDTSLLGKLSNI